eukprot:1946257-Rhodomonas_salina.2
MTLGAGWYRCRPGAARPRTWCTETPVPTYRPLSVPATETRVPTFHPFQYRLRKPLYHETALFQCLRRKPVYRQQYPRSATRILLPAKSNETSRSLRTESTGKHAFGV